MAEMVKTKLNGKFEIIIPKHRADRPEWHTTKGWERKRLDHIQQHIRKGMVVYYIGAEEGEMPALCSMWGAEVALFEPNDKVMPNIKAIWEANHLEPPLFIFEGFASDKTTLNAINAISSDWPPSADGKVIGDHGFKELLDPADIPQIMIDDIQFTEGAPDIFIMDVEGAEGKVLRGAAKTIKKHKPLIYLSLHPEQLRTYREWGAELRRWLTDFGYREKLIDYPLHEVHLFYKPKGWKL